MESGFTEKSNEHFVPITIEKLEALWEVMSKDSRNEVYLAFESMLDVTLGKVLLHKLDFDEEARTRMARLRNRVEERIQLRSQHISLNFHSDFEIRF